MQDQPERQAAKDAASDITMAATDWFVRLREDRGASTVAAFRAWREADPAHARAYDEIARMWAAPELRLASAPVAAMARSRRWPRLLAAAAVAAALFAAMEAPRIELWLRSDHLTVAGERLDRTLPDGSRVTLNTATAIATDFSGPERRVRLLQGEAFFDVVRHAGQPFVVETRFGRVRVTGTAFSVRVDNDATVVMLREGRVSVQDAAGTRQSRLAPGDTVTMKATGLGPVRQGDVAGGLAWLDGRIEIRDLPLSRAIAELARYQGGRVVLLAPGAARSPVSGVFSTRDPQTAIRTLAGAAGLSMRVAPGDYIFLY